MNIGLGIGIPFNRSQIWLSLFDPSKLFTTGVNGAWYDPSDINLTWRRNLLTYSEQFDNAAWTKASVSVTANAEVAPDGTITADLLAPSSSDSNVQRDFSPIGVAPYVFSVWLKSATGVDVSTQLVCNRSVPYTVTQTQIITVTPAWQRFTLSFIALDASTHNFAIGRASSLQTGENLYIWGAQLELGSTATPYQRITDGIQDYLQYQAQPVLYRDAAGTLPVTAVEQPVGLMLDKSKGLALGPELVTGDNSTFTNGVGNWAPLVNCTVSAVSGELLVNATSTNGTAFLTLAGLTTGRAYIVSCTARAGTSSAAQITLTPSTVIFTTSTSNTTIKGVFFAAGSSAELRVVAGTAGTFYIDNISVRELPGNHAFNPSGNSANFPVLSARYNLLTKTEQFNDGVWDKAGSSTASNANTLNFPNINEAVFQSVTTTATVGTTATFSVELSGTGTINIGCYRLAGAAYEETNLQVTLTATPTRYSVSHTIVNSGQIGFGAYISRSTGSTATTVTASKAQLRYANDGINLPAYQRVNTATDYDTVGFKPYLRFNGVSQWLQTNSIDFSYGDKMFVSAGVRKLSDAAYSVALESSATYGTNAGSFGVFAPSSNAATNYAIGLNTDGANYAGVSLATFAAPITSIISGQYSLASAGTSSQIGRVNGVQINIGTVAGAGNKFGNYPLYIGARAGTSLWFNGRLYGLTVVGKQASASEISGNEYFLNSKTNAY